MTGPLCLDLELALALDDCLQSKNRLDRTVGTGKEGEKWTQIHDEKSYPMHVKTVSDLPWESPVLQQVMLEVLIKNIESSTFVELDTH